MNELNNKYVLNKYKKRILLQSIYSSLTGLYYLFWNVVFLRYILNALEQGEEFINIFEFLIIMISISLLYFFYRSYFKKIFEPKDNLRIKKDINVEIFKKAESIKFELFEDSKFFNLYTRIKDGDKYIIEYLSHFGAFCGNLVVTLINLYIIFIIDPIIIFFSVIGIIIMVIFNNIISSLKYSMNQDIAEPNKKREYVKNVAYLADYAKEIRMTNIFDIMLNLYDKSVKMIERIVKNYSKKLIFLSAINDITLYGLSFIIPVIYILFNITKKGKMTIGDFSASVMAINMFTSRLTQLANNYQKVRENKLLIREINNFLNIRKIDNREGKIIKDKIISIRTENLSFKYPNNTIDTLNSTNIDIDKKKIAVVGINGAGKSTLIKVLAGLYSEYDGKILINNFNLKDYNIDIYRKRIGIVYQDFKLMSTSVIENILMRSPTSEKDYKLAKESLIKVGLIDRINNLPNGLDTILFKEFDKDGLILSGGEMQKLALSRILVMEPDIVIFDEPSSALDPIAEEELYQNIIQNITDKILIFITHRLSTVKLSDYIYLIDNGKIIEEGTHDELMEKEMIYYEIFNKQAEKYKEVWS